MTAAQPSERTVPSAVGALAMWLGNGASTGDVANLRRMDPDRPSPLVLYRVAAQFFPGQWDGTEASIRDWMAVAAGLAIMAPDGHRPGLELGRALARARMSEASLERLLAARADTRRTLLLRAARFMAAKVERCDWAEAAFFLLGRTDDTIEAANRRVASAYYRELDTLEAKHK